VTKNLFEMSGLLRSIPVITEQEENAYSGIPGWEGDVVRWTDRAALLRVASLPESSGSRGRNCDVPRTRARSMPAIGSWSKNSWFDRRLAFSGKRRRACSILYSLSCRRERLICVNLSGPT
jgi:hypothetical protein